MRTPTRNVLDNPDQNLRYQREVVEHMQTLEAMVMQVQTGVVQQFDSSQSKLPDEIRKTLSTQGQDLLASLNINPEIATARSNRADSAPTVDDDSTQGYGYFSSWIDTTGPDLYKCVDPSPGAAVWKLTT